MTIYLPKKKSEGKDKKKERNYDKTVSPQEKKKNPVNIPDR